MTNCIPFVLPARGSPATELLFAGNFPFGTHASGLGVGRRGWRLHCEGDTAVVVPMSLSGFFLPPSSTSLLPPLNALLGKLP